MILLKELKEEQGNFTSKYEKTFTVCIGGTRGRRKVKKKIHRWKSGLGLPVTFP